MMTFDEIATAEIETLTSELAAAGWDSAQKDVRDARQAVARLLNDTGDLRLYDSDTGDLVTSEVSDDMAAESCLTPEGHILVDTRNDAVLQDGCSEDSRRVYVAE